MYDVFFLNYNDPLADVNWNILYEKIPYARRVDGIKGILNAHRHCASLSRTSNFFVVDADNEVLDPEFSIKLSVYDKNYVHIWRAKNPLNELEYGWGGIKLFPKKILLGRDEMPLDMSTSFPLKVIPEVGSITHFNSSAFNTWRSAFRECVKLSHNDDAESYQRLKVWCNVANGIYSDACLSGACAGREHGLKYENEPEMLLKINDWLWLEERYHVESVS